MKTSGAKLALVLAAFLIQQAEGQNLGLPDMYFQVKFTPMSGSSSNLNLWGECYYNKFIRIPDYIPGAPTFTNDLEVVLFLPSTPDAVWLLKKKRDGSFEEMTELTNYGDQHFRLTTNQIRSLVKGDWYAEADYGDAKYIGNLTPEPQFANGPTAAFDFLSPVFYHEMEYGYVVIAKDNRTADVIISGTQSVDRYYLPMRYTWTRNAYFLGPLSETNNGYIFRSNFGAGNYYVGLQAYDAITKGKQVIIGLTIFTPSQAIDFISPAIQYLAISQKRIADLTMLLSQAAKYFDQGKMVQGRCELVVFIDEIKKINSNGETKPWILKYSRSLLDALDW